ncbi:ROK family transcriptional regulator [Microbacterium hydrocarbonoxydans]|uniref:ROK family transcriptional regulator n=1 Tax=Microbacterium hydrocarbonoxydans TaxID=273678 RepID=UPI0007BB7F83|nr:ROK family transcriptional regulator [Microbacterium hydrocarbonoxydans]GAT72914.1 ROK family protein [Microbacterium sp. HM58-2]
MSSESDATTRRILDLISSGRARSRRVLAEELRLAPSTVGTRVQTLIDAGIVEEIGDGASSGGRRPRLLRLAGDGGKILTATIGWHRARVGVHDLTGALERVEQIAIDLADGPLATLGRVTELFDRLVGSSSILAIGIGLRGPVGPPEEESRQFRMSIWPDFRVDRHFADRYGVPVSIDNDANFTALGEHITHFGQSKHSITVLAGSAIGSGVIVDGSIHKGATGVEGDIGHTRVAQGMDIPCACGNTGCLETVASGEGIARQLADRGYPEVRSTVEMLGLARAKNPDAITLIRAAGTQLGMVLSSVVNFFNPHAVFVTGELTEFEPFIAAVRSSIYEGCLPIATQSLRIERAATGRDGVLHGAAWSARQALSLSRR